MSYPVHLIEEHHTHIIGRKDAVTGDDIKISNKVVFCSVCHSVFLEDSWKYMDEMHCEQSKTLSFVPAPPPQITFKRKKNHSSKLESLIY